MTNRCEMLIQSMRNFVIIYDLQSTVKSTFWQSKSFRFVISCIGNQVLPYCTCSLVQKYSSNFPFLLIFNIHSCWMWVPITTCTKRLKKRDIKNWMYSAVSSSQTQPVSQTSNLLYNEKRFDKVR